MKSCLSTYENVHQTRCHHQHVVKSSNLVPSLNEQRCDCPEQKLFVICKGGQENRIGMINFHGPLQLTNTNHLVTDK